MDKRPIAARLDEIERRLSAIERVTLPLTPLGPDPNQNQIVDLLREQNKVVDALLASGSKSTPLSELSEPVDRSCQTLTDGSPVPKDRSHTNLRPDGQQEGYVVLCDSERAKGFVRPYRDAYKHVGIPGPRFSLRDLTEEEKERYKDCGYVKFEPYPEGYKLNTLGRYWTQEGLDSIGKGCGKITTMGRKIAETYARDPKFYSGTFCSSCRNHFAVGEDGEFVWYEMDGSIGPRVGT